MIANIAASLKGVRKDIQQLQISHFYNADPHFGRGIAEQLGLKTDFLG